MDQGEYRRASSFLIAASKTNECQD